MAHSLQMSFYKAVMSEFPHHFDGKVLDIGSLDINGGPHLLLDSQEYVGVDIGPGKNVHLVCHGEDLELTSNYFDVAMSSECFEHNKNWRATLHNMIRMTRIGGLIVFSCASVGREEHGTSASDGGFSAPLLTGRGIEYYKNLSRREATQAITKSQVADYMTVHDRFHCDLLFVGIKGDSQFEQIQTLRKLREEIQSRIRESPREEKSLGKLILIFFLGDRGFRLHRRIKVIADHAYRLSAGRVRGFFRARNKSGRAN